jgi:protease YdgD
MQTSLWRARFDTVAPVRVPLARCNGENRVVSRIAIAFLALSFIAAGLDSTFGRDPVDVNANAYPWSSVGKIYNSARSSCTGSVIAPNRVLTAAHCLYNRATHRFLQAGSLHFLLGYKGGEYRTHVRVASYLVGSDYNPEDAKASVRADWAILVLAEDTETTPLRLSQSPSVAGERIMVGGFSQKYPFKMTADTECQVRGVMANGLILHDCAVMHGISGAPIMKAITETDVQIVGVHVASGQVMGSPTAFAVPASSFAQRAFPPRDALK